MLETFKTLPPEYLNLIAIIICTLIAFVFVIYFIKQLLREDSRYIAVNFLENEAKIEAYAKYLQKETNSHSYLYTDYLYSTLIFIEKYFGKLKLLSYRTWEKHFLLYSFFYCIFFFYIVWLFGGSGKIGTLNVFPNENRLTISLLLIFEIVILYILLYKRKLVQNLLSKYSSLFSNLNHILQNILVTIVGIIVVLGIYLILERVVEGVIGGVSMLLILFLFWFVDFDLKLEETIEETIGEKIINFILFVLMILAFFLIINNTPLDDFTIPLFFILPFINSIFDYLSMYLSRFFGYKILFLNLSQKWKFFLNILINTLISIILVIALATTLFYIFKYLPHVNSSAYELRRFIGSIDFFYNRAYLSNPFREDVLWVTLMFATIFIPTVIHLFIGFYSQLIHYIVKPYLIKLADEFKNDENSHKKYIIATNLVLHKQSIVFKAYMFISIAIIFTFLISAITLLIKIGLNVL